MALSKKDGWSRKPDTQAESVNEELDYIGLVKSIAESMKAQRQQKT